MPTIGTLSGSVATLLKLGSRYESPIPPPRSAKRAIPPFLVQTGRQWIRSTSPISAAVTRYCGADRKSMTVLRSVIGFMGRLDPSRDTAALGDAPEVHRHQEGCHQRDPDAVEHVEAQERAGADEAAAEKPEPRIVGRSDELDVADLEQTRPRALDAQERRRG